jgi:predicted nucleic acid-binding protein
MVGAKVLFDTNILIDHMSGIGLAGAELGRYHDRAISIITWLEVMAGSSSEDESRIRAFLTAFRCLPLTTEVAERSSWQRPKQRTGSSSPGTPATSPRMIRAFGFLIGFDRHLLPEGG